MSHKLRRPAVRRPVSNSLSSRLLLLKSLIVMGTFLELSFAGPQSPLGKAVTTMARSQTANSTQLVNTKTSIYRGRPSIWSIEFNASAPNTKIQSHADSGADFKKLLQDTISQIKTALAKDCLKSSEGTRILKLVEGDEHIVTVVKVGPPLGNRAIPKDEALAQQLAFGSDVTVTWNPDDKTAFEGEPDVLRDPSAELLHELVHAHKMFQGRWQKQTGFQVFLDEAEAVGIENQYRRGQGLKQRTKYGGVKLPDDFSPQCCLQGQTACQGSCCSAPNVCTVDGCRSCPSGKTFCAGICCDKGCQDNKCVCVAGVGCPHPTLCCGAICCGLSPANQPIACCSCNGVLTCSSLGTSSCPPCPP